LNSLALQRLPRRKVKLFVKIFQLLFILLVLLYVLFQDYIVHYQFSDESLVSFFHKRSPCNLNYRGEIMLGCSKNLS